MKRLLILGEYNPDFPPHLQTDRAIEHAAAALQIELETAWISSEKIDEQKLQSCTGLWVAPGSPYKNMKQTLAAIQYVRENQVPCLGTCGGFQHMILEYARHVLNFEDAEHAEYDPYSSNIFVTRLECSLVGKEMEIILQPDSQVAQCYGSQQTTERYYCNFGLDPQRVSVISSVELRIVGSDELGEARVLELPEHPFFIGTLFVPQASSTSEEPHPLVVEFLRACFQQK